MTFRPYPNPYPTITLELNAIVHTVELPCAQPAKLLAETAFAVSGDMVLAALSIDPRSMLRGYIRPKDRRLLGRYRSKDEPRRGIGEDDEEHDFWKDGLPDTGREIGKVLPGAEFFTGRQIGTAERFIWTGLDLASRPLWFYFLFELTKGGFMAWQSAVCQMKCDIVSGMLYMSGIRAPGGNPEVTTLGMTKTNSGPTQGITYIGSGGVGFSHLSTGAIICTGSGSFQVVTGLPIEAVMTAKLVLKILRKGIVIGADSDEIAARQGDAFELTVGGNFIAADTIGLYLYAGMGSGLDSSSTVIIGPGATIDINGKWAEV